MYKYAGIKRSFSWIKKILAKESSKEKKENSLSLEKMSKATVMIEYW